VGKSVSVLSVQFYMGKTRLGTTKWPKDRRRQRSSESLKVK